MCSFCAAGMTQLVGRSALNERPLSLAIPSSREVVRTIRANDRLSDFELSEVGKGECVSDLKARALNASERDRPTATRDATVAEHYTPLTTRHGRTLQTRDIERTSMC